MMHNIEAFLWRRGIHHECIRMMLCHQIVFAGLSMVLGGLAAPLTHWPLWFASGTVLFANIFWGLTQHMSRTTLTAYRSALFVSVLVRASLRLVLAAGILYVVLVIYAAPPTLVVAGVVAGSVVALSSYALTTKKA